MRAAIYLRVSTLEEARNYLDDYKEQAVKYCKDKGYDLLVVVEVVGMSIPDDSEPSFRKHSTVIPL